jgi:hypothetical protein
MKRSVTLGVPIFTALGGSPFQASGFTGGHDVRLAWRTYRASGGNRKS